MTESSIPEKKTKTQLEQLVKANGGKFYQTNTAAADTICIAERSKQYQAQSIQRQANMRKGTVKVASLQKNGQQDIIRPSWLMDCIKQNVVDAGLPDLLLPIEPKYV